MQNKDHKPLIVATVISLILYFPTVAEILCAKHVSLFTIFLPYPVFPNLWIVKGINPVVLFIAVPFAFLKGFAWSILLNSFKHINSSNIANTLIRNIAKTIFFLLVTSLIFLELTSGLGIVFIMLAGMAGF